MSFRSRTRSSAPVDRRRSLSSSRVPSATSSGYQSPYTSSSRPLSTYTSPYSTSNQYSSRENLYNTPSRSTFSYTPSSSSRRDSNPYSSNSTYTSPYSSATADRYVSPYTSYDNGVTTAGLSLSSYTSPYKSDRGYSNPNTPYKKDYSNTRNGSRVLSSRFSTSNSNLSAYPSTSSTASSLVGRSQSFKDNDRRNRAARNEVARNGAARSESLRISSRPSRRSEKTDDDVKVKEKVTSQPKPEQPKQASPSNGVSNNGATKDVEPPKRPARRVSRSISVSSEKSEGYESGSERTSRSRLGSTSSLVSDANDLKSESTENGDLIDYKALYEAARLDNDKLKVQLKKKDEDLFAAKATVDRFANATTKNSLSELEKRERRAMERKLSEMEEELKQLQKYKTENERLRAENRALTRVVSKLTTSAQHQLNNNSNHKQ